MCCWDSNPWRPITQPHGWALQDSHLVQGIALYSYSSLDLPQPATTLPLAELPPESPSLCVCTAGRLESTLLGPQELDTWLVGTVRALQESMRDVQGRLQSLESMAVPCKQVSPVRRPRARLGQNFEGLFSGLFIQPLLSLSPRLCLLTPLPSPENGVAHGAGKEVRGSVVHPAWKWERPSFPALISLCLKSN